MFPYYRYLQCVTVFVVVNFQALESKLASCRNFVNSQPRHVIKPGGAPGSPTHSPRLVEAVVVVFTKSQLFWRLQCVAVVASRSHAVIALT